MKIYIEILFETGNKFEPTDYVIEHFDTDLIDINKIEEAVKDVALAIAGDCLISYKWEFNEP